MINHNRQFYIRVKCHDLDVQRNFQILNPCVIVKQQIGSNWIIKGQTEIIQHQRNPIFQQGLFISYQFQTSYFIAFEVYHVMNNNKIVNVQNSLANWKDFCKYRKFVNSSKSNLLFDDQVKWEQYWEDFNIWRVLQFKKSFSQTQYKATTNLLLKKWCIIDIKPQNPFIKISRQTSDQQEYIEVYRGDSITYEQEQTWLIKIQGNELCNNDFDDVLRFQVCDKQNNNQIEIGEIRLSINQIFETQNENRFLKDSQIKIKGQVRLNCQLIDRPTFEEYLKGGLQLNLMIAIDFTDSNGQFSNPKSLHYFNNEQRKLSQYEIAMMTIAKILIEYDHDKKVPLFGFGCVPQGEQATQHCYPLNKNFKNPEVHSLLQIFQTYRNFVSLAQFSGPTYIHPTIKKAADYAEKFKKEGNNNYVVLTILTDGMIDDFDQTVEKIIRICDLPISIIIIEIGDGDFGQMKELDNLPTDMLGNKASRNLVKFVKFNNFFQDTKKLASEVLSELPDQIIEYMQSVNKQPNQLQGNTISFLNEEEPDNQYFQDSINNNNLNTLNGLIYDDNVNFEEQILNNEQLVLQSIISPQSQYYVQLRTNDQ